MHDHMGCAEEIATMSNEWAQARNCNWLHEAHFVKSVLESEGIKVQIPDEHTIGLQPMSTAALGGVRVLVPVAQHARALEILRDVDTSAPAPDEPSE